MESERSTVDGGEVLRLLRAEKPLKERSSTDEVELPNRPCEKVGVTGEGSPETVEKEV